MIYQKFHSSRQNQANSVLKKRTSSVPMLRTVIRQSAQYYLSHRQHIVFSSHLSSESDNRLWGKRGVNTVVGSRRVTVKQQKEDTTHTGTNLDDKEKGQQEPHLFV